MEIFTFLFIYRWDDNANKSKCFDYGVLIFGKTITIKLGIDVGIIPTLMDNVPIRDHEDNNGIWTEAIRIFRSRILDRDLQVYESGSGRTNVSPNMSRFLQKLEHCNGENAQTLHDHRKQSKLKN